MKELKLILGVLVVAIVSSSCAQIEKATAKWKTPETQTATTTEVESQSPTNEPVKVETAKKAKTK
ncbi:MAG: hypothetical protein Q7U04_08860, partial [Bacteriovorax sp.]|nr:hypothetical protein [Bacteriovorax sp.]